MGDAEAVAMSSPSSSPVLIVLAAFAVTISSAKPLQNISIYRLTPINYTGVTNMDTGDAAGDVMFGLNQMLLPQLCPMEPDFTWCANRQYLSGGGAHMVYTQFTVESDARFGEYNACNPNADTGIFECETSSSNAQVPSQCAAGFDFEHEDCLNGTSLRTFNTVAELTEAQGACCAACSAATGQCSGWTLSAASDNSSTARTCQLITGDPVEWHGAQKTQGCTAAYAEPDAYACWYSDPQFNTSFASVCDPSKCTCNAISNMSVGREQHAMCWHHSSQTASSTQQAVRIAHEKHSKWFEYVGGLGCLTDGTWYSTRAEGECKGDVVDESCWWRLAQQHRTVNASCVDDHVVAAVQKHRPECWRSCDQPTNRSSACFLTCLFETILGNSTNGVKPLNRQDVVQPFADAFKTEQQGGCPAALCGVDDDCTMHGDSTAYCKSNGWCRCDAQSGFSGQFCVK